MPGPRSEISDLLPECWKQLTSKPEQAMIFPVQGMPIFMGGTAGGAVPPLPPSPADLVPKVGDSTCPHLVVQLNSLSSELVRIRD